MPKILFIAIDFILEGKQKSCHQEIYSRVRKKKAAHKGRLLKVSGAKPTLTADPTSAWSGRSCCLPG
jgi:hypothetical protein